MLFKYIAGNKYYHAINRSQKILSLNKIPVINFAIENNKINLSVYNEYKNIFYYLDHNYKIALKLSSFNFDESFINDIIDVYKTKDIKILIDAENNKFNNLYQDITNKLIENHNSDKLNIYKTYQMYRKDSFIQLSNDIDIFKNYHLGVKLVRGAYWNSEKNDGHLFSKKYETDFNYDNSISLIYNHHYSNNINTILATHNKESINTGLHYNKKIGLDSKKFEYGHLMGMNETVYNNINHNNKINVYIPYGPYHKMIPYLSRRLYENIDTIKYL